MAEKKKKEETPGNDILNGVERWVPEEGKRRPSQFKFQSEEGIWYKDKLEMCTCLARAGVPEGEWCDMLRSSCPDEQVA